MIYENAWAAPFAVAVREAGGQLIDHGRIPTQAVIAASRIDGEPSDGAAVGEFAV